MKKLFIACIAMALTSGLNAQKVKFGIKTGFNIASINGKDAANIDAKSDLFIGATLEVVLTDKFSIQPEIIYSPQGAKMGDEYTLDLNYISMPIMVKYYLVEGFSIEAGPQFSFLLKDEISTNTSSPDFENTDAENFDFALNAGLGYQLKNGLFFQTRYSLGLTRIFDWDPPVKNGVFQLSLGYQF
ncbi:MAG: PorT family protein [Flavobacteriaceae bacterium]|nr:PorT family protein [Flavobacteriaceae bacterium]